MPRTLRDKKFGRPARPTDPRKRADGDEAYELYIMIDTGSLGEPLLRRWESMQTNLGKKYKKGIYDRQLGVKMFQYLVDEAARMMKATQLKDAAAWNRENPGDPYFGGTAGEKRYDFNPRTRRLAAARLESDFNNDPLGYVD